MRGRTVSVVVAVAMTAGACGGGDASPAGDAVARDDDTPASDSAAFTALDFLGDLPVDVGEPVASTMGPTGGTIDIDEARLIAPAGAFDTDTVITAQTFLLGVVPDEDVWSRAFVVSTVDDVDLNSPVVIEVDRPAAGMRAVQIIDGETTEVPVEGTETARVEIPHFSEVVTMMIDDFNRERAAERARAEQGEADATFFTACFVAVSGLTGGSIFEIGGETSNFDRRYAQELAISVCTTALIRRASPSGVTVSTGCVGDRIGGDVDLRAAIAECAAEATDGDDADADADQAPPDADDDEPSADTSPPATAPSGPAAWAGTLSFDPDAGTLVDSFVGIERLADGTYTLGAYVEFTRESQDCFWVERQTADAVGQPTPDGTRIELEGEFTSDIEASGDGCAGGSETYETTYQFDVNGDTISGSIFPYTTFSITN